MARRDERRPAATTSAEDIKIAQCENPFLWCLHTHINTKFTAIKLLRSLETLNQNSSSAFVCVLAVTRTL